MIYYKVKCNYSYAEGLGEREQKRIWEDISIDIRFGETQYKLFVYHHDESSFDSVMMFSIQENSLSSVKESLLNEIELKHKKRIHVSFSGDPEEITAEDAVSLTHKGITAGYHKSYMRGSRRAASELCKAGYVSSSDLQFVEYVLPHPDLPYEDCNLLNMCCLTLICLMKKLLLKRGSILRMILCLRSSEGSILR